jgi:hypothetical protein
MINRFYYHFTVGDHFRILSPIRISYSLAFDFRFVPQEPERPLTPPPTIELYTRVLPPSSASGTYPWNTLKIRLVGSHPLWGHHL